MTVTPRSVTGRAAVFLSAIVLAALAGCGSPLPTRYGEVVLPEPAAVGADVPPAWLVVGGRAHPGTVAAFTWSGAHAEPAYGLPNLDRVSIAGGATEVVIAARSIDERQAWLRPWNSDGRIAPLLDHTVPEIAVQERGAGDLTVLAFAVDPITEDRLLEVHVTFGKGDAFYVWRLGAPG